MGSDAGEIAGKLSDKSETGRDGFLDDRQRRVIPFIVAAPTIEEGCRRAEITTTCFYAWLRDPAFAQELRATRDAVVSDAMDNLKQHVTKAVDELAKLLDSQSENIRRKAASDIISFVTKWRELGEIEGRLESIERLVLERRTYKP